MTVKCSSRMLSPSLPTLLSTLPRSLLFIFLSLPPLFVVPPLLPPSIPSHRASPSPPSDAVSLAHHRYFFPSVTPSCPHCMKPERRLLIISSNKSSFNLYEKTRMNFKNVFFTNKKKGDFAGWGSKECVRMVMEYVVLLLHSRIPPSRRTQRKGNAVSKKKGKEINWKCYNSEYLFSYQRGRALAISQSMIKRMLSPSPPTPTPPHIRSPKQTPHPFVLPRVPLPPSSPLSPTVSSPLPLPPSPTTSQVLLHDADIVVGPLKTRIGIFLLPAISSLSLPSLLPGPLWSPLVSPCTVEEFESSVLSRSKTKKKKKVTAAETYIKTSTS